MPIFSIDLPPIQKKFTEEDVRSMKMGRRQLRTEWQNALYPPEQPDKNWRVILPFANTYENAFACMCNVNFHPYRAKEDKLIIFLNGTEGDQEAPAEVVDWVGRVMHPVAMKDCLSISFALDYDRAGGRPQSPQTEIGILRAYAKPYGPGLATDQTLEAADKLAALCVNFLNNMSCYSSADCIVAIPPSDPLKAFNLPRYLAKRIAKVWGREDLSNHVIGKSRNQLKEVSFTHKLDTLIGTIEVADGVFTDRNVLLIDDLYQSGVSMNYCGLRLLQSGAKKLFGLACEKACRNDDNVGRKI